MLATEQAWANLLFTEKDEKTFLKRYGSALTPHHHKARLEWLLWMNHQDSAKRMLSRVSLSDRLLAQARLAFKTRKNLQRSLQELPSSLRHNPGLLYDKLIWLMEEKKEKEALEFVKHLMAHLKRPWPYPELWWKQKNILIRNCIREKNYDQAYKLSLHHGLSSGFDLVEAEWIGGWLSLRYLKNPTQARPHLLKMLKHAETPISRAKASYWLGRSYEASGQAQEASAWYKKASEFPTTFYGQLAGKKVQNTPSLWKEFPSSPQKNHASYKGLLERALLLQQAGGSQESLTFLKHIAGFSLSPSQQQDLIRTIYQTSGPYSGHVVEVSKKANRSHEVRLKEAYPSISLPPSSLNPALVLGLIRQESCFNMKAKSSANALGMMQLVAPTAREMAQKIGVHFHLASLIQNPHYNIRLGVTYFERILNAYDGSVILALAAYNAGMGKVKKWLKDYGNPHAPGEDPIDWIEKIPYAETRSYIHRVLEGMAVYESLLKHPHQKPQIVQTHSLKSPLKSKVSSKKETVALHKKREEKSYSKKLKKDRRHRR